MNELPVSADLWALLRDVRILSPTTVALPGEAPSDGVRLSAMRGHPRPSDPLTAALQDLIYRRCYLRRPNQRASAPVEDPAFVAALVAANHGREGWSLGWRLEAQDQNGTIIARKGDTRVDSATGSYQVCPPAPGQQPSREIALRASPGSLTAQRGFYFVFGTTFGDRDDEAKIARLYFNIPAASAPALVAHISGHLNAYDLPFRFKCLTEPAGYLRSDAAVLYVARRYLASAWLILTSKPGVLENLAPTVPMWSRRLAPGLGAAEDPGAGESFGMHRARLTAEGISAAHRRGAEDPGRRLVEIHQRFVAAGLDPARPHLNPGSADFDGLPATAWGEVGQ